MRMLDVNILVHAHREESPAHARYALWLTTLATGPEPFALSEPALQGFVRIVTNPKIFDPPSTLSQAFAFIDALRTRPQCVMLRPGPSHWKIYRELCEASSVMGKLTADAAHAALAIETGCEWISSDTDFARFAPPLRWQHL
jgi:toxin-antitoxin system PIN domain toxin